MAIEQYFVGVAERLLSVPFLLYKERFLTDRFVLFLFLLYEVGSGPLSFDVDSVSLTMLVEFIFSFLSESKNMLYRKKSCSCMALFGLTLIHKKLERVSVHLEEYEDSILDCFVFKTYKHRPSSGLHSWSRIPGENLLLATSRSTVNGVSSGVLRYCVPCLSSFALDQIKIDSCELPFDVRDFVREARYRMVRLSYWVLCCTFGFTDVSSL